MEATKQLDVQPQETLVSWLVDLNKAGFKALPVMAKTLIIQIAFVLAIQLVFWWNGISRYIPSAIKAPVIFLTATYNDIIPKTLFWIILFTFGKRLFFRIKKSGFQKAMRPIMSLVPEFKKTMDALAEKSYSLLLIGGGVGLIVANNFASYSRFSGARNKIDKYFIAIVISFTISYLLGEGRKHWMFKFGRLAVSDFSRVFKTEVNYSDDHTFILLSGFVMGMLLDAPIIFLKIGYGGYVLGTLSIIVGIILKLFYKRG
jgi:hypothetical protein